MVEEVEKKEREEEEKERNKRERVEESRWTKGRPKVVLKEGGEKRG